MYSKACYRCWVFSAASATDLTFRLTQKRSLWTPFLFSKSVILRVSTAFMHLSIEYQSFYRFNPRSEPCGN